MTGLVTFFFNQKCSFCLEHDWQWIGRVTEKLLTIVWPRGGIILHRALLCCSVYLSFQWLRWVFGQYPTSKHSIAFAVGESEAGPLQPFLGTSIMPTWGTILTAACPKLRKEKKKKKNILLERYLLCLLQKQALGLFFCLHCSSACS